VDASNLLAVVKNVELAGNAGKVIRNEKLIIVVKAIKDEQKEDVILENIEEDANIYILFYQYIYIYINVCFKMAISTT